MWVLWCCLPSGDPPVRLPLFRVKKNNRNTHFTYNGINLTSHHNEQSKASIIAPNLTTVNNQLQWKHWHTANKYNSIGRVHTSGYRHANVLDLVRAVLHSRWYIKAQSTPSFSFKSTLLLHINLLNFKLYNLVVESNIDCRFWQIGVGWWARLS